MGPVVTAKERHFHESRGRNLYGRASGEAACPGGFLDSGVRRNDGTSLSPAMTLPTSAIATGISSAAVVLDRVSPVLDGPHGGAAHSEGPGGRAHRAAVVQEVPDGPQLLRVQRRGPARDCVQICHEGDRRLQKRRGATKNTSGLVGSFGTIQDDEYRQRSQGQALRFTGCPGMCNRRR